MPKSKPKPAAMRTGSPGALQALLRGGAGAMADRRTKRTKTRQAQLRAALRDS